MILKKKLNILKTHKKNDVNKLRIQPFFKDNDSFRPRLQCFLMVKKKVQIVCKGKAYVECG